jgi:hypothetical protein
MKHLKDIILEKLRIGAQNNDFVTILNLMKEIKKVDLDDCFIGNKERISKTHSGGSIYVIVYSEKQTNAFTMWCASKSGEISDVVTMENNDELYKFLSTRLVDSEPEEFIDVVIDYLYSLVRRN